MTFYREHVLLWLIDLSMRQSQLAPPATAMAREIREIPAAARRARPSTSSPLLGYRRWPSPGSAS
jgi:hypothetical protein